MSLATSRRPDWRLSTTLTACLLLLSACGGGNGDGVDNAVVTPPVTPPVTEPAVPDTACEVVNSGGSVVVGSGLPGDPAAPEPASGYRLGKTAVHAKQYMVVTANPLASRAGCDVLKQGGSAVDAAVAVQMVLGLVEPQSSGLGGGAFMLHYDAAQKKVVAYDGRETAPAAATENYLRWVSDTQRTAPQPGGARASGRSIGTPGAVRMLEMAHKDHGKLAWNGLFGSAEQLASNGFQISGRMADAIRGGATGLSRDPEAVAYFFNADGSPRALGTTIKNPAYAATLKTIAEKGADGFYTGAVAQGIVDKIRVTSGGTPAVAITPGLTTMEDLANYQAKRRDPVCTTYRAYWVCGMSPPSSGGIAVASALGILENFDLSIHKPTAIDIEGGKPTVMGVHLVSEAERLAYADRDKYVADTDFVSLPGGSPAMMLDKNYLRSRAGLIRFDRSMGTASAGVFGTAPAGVSLIEERGTTHFSIVDKQGNAVVMTTTVEAGMGSYHMTQGFLLNNQLTDFSATPTDSTGAPVANRVEPGKRPRSSMAPTLVFKKNADGSMGDFLMGTGSPGGGTIIQYVVKTVVGALDWGLDAQQATNLVDFGASNSATTSLGGEHPSINTANGGADDPLIMGLRGLGHTVSTSAQSSGIGTIIRVQRNGQSLLQGGADPRREGIVLGDAIQP
ncbi:gamma-glutamyltransferase [Comamonas endophytica]|uniref:Glutathione hydrolase proenzyme n=1 Tax=Comamonas endophytica TaxID=2949090 RepID=A0ABY6GE47_9BURK|nr:MULTISPECIES: gamma-glutamyltransferase [unclassified Acidovorax]MCD2513274.1 gamma-glutamyltransferase [Acidovorax sp. D4N7]UYG53383.1 gamma-glutamyltransferase [Acidovorax sp. 5MLIR]